MTDKTYDEGGYISTVHVSTLHMFCVHSSINCVTLTKPHMTCHFWQHHANRLFDILRSFSRLCPPSVSSWPVSSVSVNFVWDCVNMISRENSIFFVLFKFRMQIFVLYGNTDVDNSWELTFTRTHVFTSFFLSDACKSPHISFYLIMKYSEYSNTCVAQQVQRYAIGHRLESACANCKYIYIVFSL